MIIKSDDFELEVSKGNDIYFASKYKGQIFKKWDELDNNDKLLLEVLKKRIEKLILEAQENLFEKEIDNGAGRSGIDRRQFSYDQYIPERRYVKEREAERIEG
jgi:hypothetical protein